MRIVFSAGPASGHVLPLLPLMDAARAQGHEVLLVSGSGGGALAPGYDVVEIGPSVAEAMSETERRMEGDDGRHPGGGAIEMFAGVRVEGFSMEAIRQVSEFNPDLLVSETFDMLGPLVAAALGVPRVEHKISGPIPADLIEAFQTRVQSEYRVHSITPSPAVLILDPFPASLTEPDEIDQSTERLPVRPISHRDESSGQGGLPARQEGEEDPVALVTLGTSVQDADAMSALVSSIAGLGIRCLVTADKNTLTVPEDAVPLVHELGFIPLAEVLPLVDVVISAGGTGTLLAALSEGKPVVIRPFVADQPWNALRAAKSGVAIVIDDFADAGTAVLSILDSDEYRDAARSMRAEIQGMDDPATVMRALAEKFTAPALINGTERSR
jgi:UDP:flavonoid glycosyltransferase YjiC (YdhE family)